MTIMSDPWMFILDCIPINIKFLKKITPGLFSNLIHCFITWSSHFHDLISFFRVMSECTKWKLMGSSAWTFFALKSSYVFRIGSWAISDVSYYMWSRTSLHVSVQHVNIIVQQVILFGSAILPKGPEILTILSTYVESSWLLHRPQSCVLAVSTDAWDMHRHTHITLYASLLALRQDSGSCPIVSCMIMGSGWLCMGRQDNIVACQTHPALVKLVLF